jgi:hypothetical protein
MPHATVFPLTSVIVMRVLLKVELMWTMPVATFFFARRFCCLPLSPCVWFGLAMRQAFLF